MLNDETKRKLRLMNIGEFISAVDLQEDDPQLLALPFSERFQMAVDHVYQDKYNMKSERLIKQAKLRFPAADIHDIYYGEKRRLNRNLMGEIATCQYIEKSIRTAPRRKGGRTQKLFAQRSAYKMTECPL